jgi:hypothetical protein
MIATVMGLRRLDGMLSRRLGRRKARGLTYVAVTYCVLMSAAAMPDYPGDFEQPEHIRAFLAAASRIGPEESVCAQDGLHPHLALRRDATLFSTDSAGNDYDRADCVVLDVHASHWPFRSREAYVDAVLAVLRRSDYGVAHHADGVIVLRRNHPRHENERAAAVIAESRGE